MVSMTLRTALVRDLTRKLNQKKGFLNKGFTLIELIVVVVIIGVLAAVGIPQFNGVRDRAEAKAYVGEAVGLAKECAVLQLEKESGSTITDPAGNSVTCDGSAAASFSSQTWSTSLTVKCASASITGTSASLAITTAGVITCS